LSKAVTSSKATDCASRPSMAWRGTKWTSVASWKSAMLGLLGGTWAK
jgi:hypothetical protein